MNVFKMIYLTNFYVSNNCNQELRSRTTPTFTLEQLDGRKALLDKTQQVLKGKASAKAYKAQAKIIQKFLK